MVLQCKTEYLQTPTKGDDGNEDYTQRGRGERENSSLLVNSIE